MKVSWRWRNDHLAKDERRLRQGTLSPMSSVHVVRMSCTGMPLSLRRQISKSTLLLYTLGCKSRANCMFPCVMMVVRYMMNSDKSRCGRVSVRWSIKSKIHWRKCTPYWVHCHWRKAQEIECCPLWEVDEENGGKSSSELDSKAMWTSQLVESPMQATKEQTSRNRKSALMRLKMQTHTENDS